MRILSCNIHGFGGLSDYQIDFNSGVTCINEKNGFGKTTLAAFIKAMFFGLPTARKNSLTDSNERAKYYPWDPSVPFGGQLVFSLGDKSYRIIRKFHSKSPTRDEFMLLDAETGFESTDFSEKIGEELFGLNEEAFVKSTFSNGSVNLDGLPENIRAKISSAVNVADDLGSYETARKKLEDAAKERKKLINECRAKIQNAKTDIERLKAEKEEFTRINSYIAELSYEREKLQKEQEKLAKIYDDAARFDADNIKKKLYDEASERCQVIKAQIDVLNKKYSNFVPDKDFANEFSKACKDIDAINNALNTEREKAEQFSDRAVFKVFENNLPTDEQIDKMRELERIAILQDAATRKAPPKAALPLACAFLAAGMGLYSVNSLAATIVTIVCAVCVFVLIALTTASHAEKTKSSNEKNAAICKLEDFLKQYYPQKEAKLSDLVSERDIFVKYYAPAKNKVLEIESDLKENKKYIASLIEKIGYLGQNAHSLSLLCDEIERDSEGYILKQNELKEYLLKKEENYDPDAIGRLENSENSEQREDVSKKISEVRERLRSLDDNILDQKNRLNMVASAQENLNEQQDILDNENDNLIKYQGEAEIISKTEQLLETAKNELFKKYAQKIIDALDKYSNVFFKEDKDDFYIGTELDVGIKRDGIARQASLFSEGQQSVIDVCLRLSLIDAMSEAERPFMVLDDPFASMDNKNFEKAAELIKSVSENTQIIYLTCHSSREI